MIVMRLTELEPRWQRPNAFPDHWRTGITFVCPACRTHRVAVTFAIPVVPNPMSDMERDSWAQVVKHEHKDAVWTRVGDTFDTMTLTPSVNFQPRGCWHGTIENGEARP